MPELLISLLIIDPFIALIIRLCFLGSAEIRTCPDLLRCFIYYKATAFWLSSVCSTAK